MGALTFVNAQKTRLPGATPPPRPSRYAKAPTNKMPIIGLRIIQVLFICAEARSGR